MKANTTPESDPGATRARPRNVDLALGAIVLRCLLALASAFALFGAKDELRRNAAELHPEWSAATLVERVDSELRSNVLLTLIYIALVLLIAKFIRDGRNWARWLYAFVAFLVAGDVLRVTGFFTGDNLLFRLLSGFTGVASLASIVLLFSPSSTAFFRPVGGPGSMSPLRTLFGSRAAAVASRGDAGRPGGGTQGAATKGPGTATAEPVSLSKPAAKRAPDRRPNGSKRPAPRAKSRKQAAE
ncbi:MAG TPA: hypothetical protein VF557_14055 [Jatrophihabitans sp.]|jgi:hypothetical protein|uniref:hypothetical protein n=1 Tax=Jatrophihabitans sp. TaxID=1932789 RepID=UPI002F067172